MKALKGFQKPNGKVMCRAPISVLARKETHEGSQNGRLACGICLSYFTVGTVKRICRCQNKIIVCQIKSDGEFRSI